MLGRNTSTLKPKTLHESRPLRITSCDEVLNSTEILEPGTQEPYHESYFWWIHPDNTITMEDIAALYEYQSGEHFAY